MPRTVGGSTRSRAGPSSTTHLSPAGRSGRGAARHAEQLERLLGTLEQEILPRLVVAHRPPEQATGQTDDVAVERAEIAALIQHALTGQLTDALALVERTLRDGASIERVLLDLVGEAARGLGDAWLDDACSFTQVTVGLGTLQQLVLALRPTQVATPTRGAVLLVAAPGEQHTLGVMILADLMRRAGLEVRLETAPSIDAVAALAAAEPWVAVGISMSSERLATGVAALIARIHERSAPRHPAILLGGSLGGSFDGPAFARANGAALWASDARDALAWVDAHLTLPPVTK